MKQLPSHIMLPLVLLTMLISCTSEQEDLILDGEYLQVADVLHYCQGTCDQEMGWEGSAIRITGYIPDVGDAAAMQDHYEKDHFYIHDVRNGMFLQVRVTGDKDAIFEFLNGITKSDAVYILGTAESVITNEGNECLKGVVIFLDSSENLTINL